MFSVDWTALTEGVFNHATIVFATLLPLTAISSGLKLGFDLMVRIERIFARAV